MSAYSDMILDAHRELIADGAGSDITAGAVTRAAILSPAEMSEELRKSGLMLQITQTAALERAFFVALGIEDRSEVTVDGQQLKVMLIKKEPADPIVVLHLKPER